MSRTKPLVTNLIGIAILLVLLFPIYWMIITSFKTTGEIFRTPPTLIPGQLYTEGYASQLSAGMGRSFANSLIVGISSMVIVVVLSIPAAYGLSRFHVPGKKWIILFFLVTQMLPVTVVLTPLFIMFRNLQLLNSLAAPILATTTMGIPFSVLILRTYFLGAPKELENAALIDGCNRLTTFIRIMIPISMPGIIVSTAVFSFLFAWGDLIYGMTFIADSSKWPLTAGVYDNIGKYGIEWNNLMSYATITVLPVLAIFILMQRFIIAGLTSGAVK